MSDSTSPAVTTGQPAMVSEWLHVTQSMIDEFGAVTLDPDPMHQDPDWASNHSPFGGTIAYGFLTLSLMTHLLHSARKSLESGHRPEVIYLNYGCNSLRLVSPVRVGVRIRGHFAKLGDDGMTRHTGYPIQRLACRVEIENEAAPALVAEWLTVVVPPSEAR